MQKITSRQIRDLVAYLGENISVYAGKDDNRRILIKPGLKITNKQTGLEYTVKSVMKNIKGDGLAIVCTREPDIVITITGKELKHFERT